jgi:lysophospholipase L1-like esterase
VRLLDLAPPLPLQYSTYAASPWLTYGPKPHSRHEGLADTGEYRYDFRHNRYGLRDTEHDLARPPGTFRILGLGDSFTYGVGAAFEETWLYRLEQALNARAAGNGPGRVEIIKAGVARYFPEPERLLLEKLGPRFDPDLVLVGFTPNDLIDTCLGLEAITVDESGFLMSREARLLGPVGLQLYLHSAFARLLLSKLVVSGSARACYAPADGARPREWAEIEAEYARMAGLAAGIGARFAVVYIPERGPWGEAQDDQIRRLRAWSAAHGAQFIDALPAFRAHPHPDSLHYAKDGHCTPAGYALVADAVARALQ